MAGSGAPWNLVLAMRSSKTLPGNRGQRIQALFEAARGLGPAQQAAFLDRACAGDIEIRRELDAILAAARGPTDQRLRKLMDADMDRTAVDEHTAVARRVRDQGRAAQTLLPEPGTRIGQYEIVRELGRGGMAVVYLARDVKLGRRVAIKFLQANEGSLARRFVLEAQATARCVHENIVVIHDVKEYQGNPFMVLEYLQGQTLGSYLKDGKVPAYRAVQLMTPVVRALVCAHEHKLVHRDLKPGNIFLTSAGAIKVLDFGVAKYLQRELPRGQREPLTGTMSLPSLAGSEHTGHGVLVGTMPFMSPEQWNADPVDHRTDLWAVGIMLYMMVVGRPRSTRWAATSSWSRASSTSPCPARATPAWTCRRPWPISSIIACASARSSASPRPRSCSPTSSASCPIATAASSAWARAPTPA